MTNLRACCGLYDDEEITAAREVLGRKGGSLFLGYLLGRNYRRRDRDHLVPPRRTDAAVCRAEVCGREHGRHRAVRRREFITSLGGAAAWPLAARAQTKRARIGWFTVAPHPYIDGFRQGLRELGWIEGENLAIEPIYADGHPERLPGLASVLARVPYDLVVASGSDAVEAARAAIQSIPIVGVSSSMGTGGSLARSEGNLSGIALLFDEGRHQVAGAADRNGSARTGRFVERDDALTCLRHMRAGAEVLQICRIGGDGAGLLGIGPGLLVGLLARLLIGRLLLRRLLRIRGLAAS